MPRLQYTALNLDFLNSFEMLGKKMSISLKKKCFMDEERFLKCEKQDWVGIPRLEQLTNLMKKMRRNLLNIFFSNCLLIMKKLFQQKPSHTHTKGNLILLLRKLRMTLTIGRGSSVLSCRSLAPFHRQQGWCRFKRQTRFFRTHVRNYPKWKINSF